jgi:hypothetical protein
MNAVLLAALFLSFPGATPAGEEKSPGDPGAAEGDASLPTAAFKTPEGQIKFQQALKKVSEDDYAGAKELLAGAQKEAVGPEDKKTVQGVIDDCRLGPEIEAARSLMAKKDERGALNKLEKLLRDHPKTCLRPKAEKIIREAEEIIYVVLDDFEAGERLQPQNEDVAKAAKGNKGLNRLVGEQSINTDPQYVRHGKGSMKWRLGEVGNLQKKLRNVNLNLNTYESPELKSPIVKWKQLVFWLHLPEEDEGVLQVVLAPGAKQETKAKAKGKAEAEFYGQKPIDLRGKRGWMEMRLDLRRDFGSAHPVKLEDVRFVQISITKPKDRTIYLDFVHLE